MSDLFGWNRPAPELLDPERRYLYEERWAIMHYDGGLPEDVAKARALEEVWNV